MDNHQLHKTVETVMMAIRRNILMAIVALITVPGMAWAETSWQEGEHYTVVSPAVRVGPTDQVIVTEFFWYGCGHCYTFEPMLQAWKQTLPEGSRLQPSPAAWNDGMKLHAKAYFTAETLGVLVPMHDAIFKAMHVERNRLGSKGAIRELFAANGVPAEDFDRAFDSFGVNSQVSQAEARARSAKISGTPSVLVNGKYLIEARKAGSQANMLKIADFLVQQELAKKS